MRRWFDSLFLAADDATGAIILRDVDAGGALDGGAEIAQATPRIAVEKNTGIVLFKMAVPTFLTGEIKLLAGATAPIGWVLCNGAALSRETYSALFAALPKVSDGSMSTLNAGIDAAAGAIDVGGWDKWPMPSTGAFIPFELKIGSEIILVTARTGDTTASVIRGCEGTTAAAHSTGAAVSFPTQLAFGAGDGKTTFNVPNFSGQLALNPVVPNFNYDAQPVIGANYYIKA